jgi:hypothetical protein
MKQASLILGLLILAASGRAQSTQEGQSSAPATMPPPAASAILPAQDHHEGLTVSAEPCIDPTKAEQIFGKQNPYKGGILALEVTFHNETPQPMRLTMNSIRLEIGASGEVRDKVESLNPRQVARLIIYPGGSPDVTTKRRLPTVNTPTHDKKVDKLTDELRPFALDADVIPPMATIHGYLFFDVDHDFALVPDSMLYIPDIKIVAGNKPLMFFEIPLASTIQH